jgi:hypothetical protein
MIRATHGEETTMITKSETTGASRNRRWLAMIVMTLLAVGTATLPAAASAGQGSPAGGSGLRGDAGVACAEAAINAGWTGEDLLISVAVSLAESDCTANAVNEVGEEGGECAWSQDLGAWQLNNCWWDVDQDRWDEIQYSADYAYVIWGELGWPGWTTYNNGMYLDRLGEAQAAIDAAGGEGHPTGVVTTGDGSPLQIRSGPSTSDPVVGSLSEGTVVAIACQTHGESVYSEVWEVSTDLWDQVGPGEYVTDAYVDTGSFGQVAPDC